MVMVGTAITGIAASRFSSSAYCGSPSASASRQRRLARLLAADQIAADRHHGLDALWPEHGHDIGTARAPVISGDDGLLDLQRVHQRDDVDGKRRRLAVPDGLTGEKARGAVAA